MYSWMYIHDIFPPRSEYSASSKSIFETLGDLTGLEVADIGCGSGIESIVAILLGAKHVDAADISSRAIECAQHNVMLNGLQGKITVFESDLFSRFPNKTYDCIIANLPIVNFKTTKSLLNDALYDEDFVIHKRFFIEAKQHLSTNGRIAFVHANLQSAHTDNPNYDFEAMEKMYTDFGYVVTEKHTQKDLGYTWIHYTLQAQK